MCRRRLGIYSNSSRAKVFTISSIFVEMKIILNQVDEMKFNTYSVNIQWRLDWADHRNDWIAWMSAISNARSFIWRIKCYRNWYEIEWISVDWQESQITFRGDISTRICIWRWKSRRISQNYRLDFSFFAVCWVAKSSWMLQHALIVMTQNVMQTFSKLPFSHHFFMLLRCLSIFRFVQVQHSFFALF